MHPPQERRPRARSFPVLRLLLLGLCPTRWSCLLAALAVFPLELPRRAQAEPAPPVNVGMSTFAQPRLLTWRWEDARLVMDPGATDDPVAVGSLVKPFLAKAWAQAHPDQAPPHVNCGPKDGCWQRPGHGRLDLARALSVSCNTYFRTLVEATPLEHVNRVLAQEGFLGVVKEPRQALGLVEGLRIRPSDLLAAYRRLVRTPWPLGESLRRSLLLGLREAALTGSASGLQVRGYYAKTGTSPTTDGHPAHTTGWVTVLDEVGWAVLARLTHGTGKEVADLLAEPMAHPRAWVTPHLRRPGPLDPDKDRVKVRFFSLLKQGPFKVVNRGQDPVALREGFLGSGATQVLRVGDRVGPGLLEVQAPGNLVRRVQGTLQVLRGMRLVVSLRPRDYVGGVLAAELPGIYDSRRLELGAAVLRFLAQGRRHAEADVCDSTHCAWFIGLGPRLLWPSPTRAEVLKEPVDPGPSDREWQAMVHRSQEPGPSVWSAHCGGAPLSPHALWGGGDVRVTPCPRHGGSSSRPWTRTWTEAQVAKAFGGPVLALRIAHPAGIWSLQMETTTGVRTHRYDEAHRRLAEVLGWDTLPSPPDTLQPIPGGWRAQGRGWGHRVGLCLGD